MTGSNNTGRALTSLQRAILDVLSSKGPMGADGVREGLRAKFPLKDSSVRTLLRRLEARGLVSHTVEGQTFLYRAEMAPGRVAARAVERMIHSFWAGSAEKFLAGLVDENVLSAAELERLAKKVRSRK